MTQMGKEPGFSSLKLRPFASPGFGLVLNAPESWRDNSDESLFQVVDPATDAEFTASAYENSGMTLQAWADARLAVVEKAMPFLKQIKAPCEVKGAGWTGIAAQYQGSFAGRDYESRYLVLCLVTERVLISFTVTARIPEFTANEALYRWLLEHQTHVYQVGKIQADAQGAAKLREFAEKGSADAQFHLGVMYELGLGVPRDREQAVAWWRRSASLGHAGARTLLVALTSTY